MLSVVVGDPSRGPGQTGCRELSKEVERARRRAELRRQRSKHAAGLAVAFGEDDDLVRCGTFVPPPRRPGELEGMLQLFRMPSGEVFLGGTHRCRKPALCPWCGATVSAHLAQVLGTGVARWAARRSASLMLTLTVAHGRSDALGDLLAVLDECVRRLFTRGRSREATAVMARWRLATWGGLLETMDGPRNGWGPHLHLAIFLDRPELDDEEVAELEHELATLVCRWQEDLWHRPPSIERVLSVVQFRNGQGLAEYLTKAGLEMTGGSGKDGRSGETRSFHAMCVDLAELVAGRSKDDVRAGAERAAVDQLVARLHEYRDAHHGRAFFRSGSNFWSLLVPDVEERSSQAIVAAGQRLRHSDTVMLNAAAAELRVVVGAAADEVVGVAEEDQAAAEVVGAIDAGVWAQIVRALRYRRFPPDVHLLELIQGSRYGPHAALCETVERVGVEQALRQLALLLPRPPLVWRTGEGVVVLSDRVPAGAVWDLVEDWAEAAA